MAYITSVERIGYERVLKDGIEIGFKISFKIGVEKTMASVIARKFGLNSEVVLSILQSLVEEQREEFLEAVWKMATRDEFWEYIRRLLRD